MGAGEAGAGSGRSVPGSSAEHLGAGGETPAPIPLRFRLLRKGITGSAAPGSSRVVAAGAALAAAHLPSRPSRKTWVPRCGRAGQGLGGLPAAASPLLCALARSLPWWSCRLAWAVERKGRALPTAAPSSMLGAWQWLPGKPRGRKVQGVGFHSGSKGEGEEGV